MHNRQNSAGVEPCQVLLLTWLGVNPIHLSVVLLEKLRRKWPSVVYIVVFVFLEQNSLYAGIVSGLHRGGSGISNVVRLMSSIEEQNLLQRLAVDSKTWSNPSFLWGLRSWSPAIRFLIYKYFKSEKVFISTNVGYTHHPNVTRGAKLLGFFVLFTKLVYF